MSEKVKMLIPFQHPLANWIRELNRFLGLPKPALENFIMDLGVRVVFLVDVEGMIVWTVGTILIGVVVGLLIASKKVREVK